MLHVIRFYCNMKAGNDKTPANISKRLCYHYYAPRYLSGGGGQEEEAEVLFKLHFTRKPAGLDIPNSF